MISSISPRKFLLLQLVNFLLISHCVELLSSCLFPFISYHAFLLFLHGATYLIYFSLDVKPKILWQESENVLIVIPCAYNSVLYFCEYQCIMSIARKVTIRSAMPHFQPYYITNGNISS
jgi:hypothetical protein